MSYIYAIEIQLAATAYIRANDEEEALGIAKALKDDTLEVAHAGGDVEISDLQLDDPDLPDVSLSPAMTVIGPFEPIQIELAAELVDEEVA